MNEFGSNNDILVSEKPTPTNQVSTNPKQAVDTRLVSTVMNRIRNWFHNKPEVLEKSFSKVPDAELAYVPEKDTRSTQIMTDTVIDQK